MPGQSLHGGHGTRPTFHRSEVAVTGTWTAAECSVPVGHPLGTRGSTRLERDRRAHSFPRPGDPPRAISDRSGPALRERRSGDPGGGSATLFPPDNVIEHEDEIRARSALGTPLRLGLGLSPHAEVESWAASLEDQMNVVLADAPPVVSFGDGDERTGECRGRNVHPASEHSVPTPVAGARRSQKPRPKGSLGRGAGPSAWRTAGTGPCSTASHQRCSNVRRPLLSSLVTGM